MPSRNWQRLFLLILLTLLDGRLASARPSSLHWERIHVYHIAASVVFAKLGLTHSTKNGHTRDGKQGVPDPMFPPGLTDVVPYDADKMLLVRGTDNGLTLFRARVAAADVSYPRLHLHAELVTQSGITETPFGQTDLDNLVDSIPTEITLGEGDTARVYQIKEHTNPDGTLWVACRVSLPLPPSPPAVTDGVPTEAVFVPDRVWTDPMSHKVHFNTTATFEDLASVRQTAAKKLGATGADATDDYTLRVTLTPMASTPMNPATTP